VRGGRSSGSPEGQEPEAVADARRFGASEAELDAIRARLTPRAPTDGYAGIWRENLPVVKAFAAAGTQWRTAPIFDGRGARVIFIGLDYAGARTAMELSGIEITADLWRGVQVMEAAALAELNRSA